MSHFSRMSATLEQASSVVTSYSSQSLAVSDSTVKSPCVFASFHSHAALSFKDNIFLKSIALRFSPIITFAAHFAQHKSFLQSHNRLYIANKYLLTGRSQYHTFAASFRHPLYK